MPAGELWGVVAVSQRSHANDAAVLKFWSVCGLKCKLTK
jgi:hypothetical protein